MGQLRTSEPRTSVRSAAAVSRSCRRCGRPMRIIRVQRHPRYRNLQERVFTCECGAEESDFVAEKK
jgi:hypothetical protein